MLIRILKYLPAFILTGIGTASANLCPLGDAIETDGHRRLALIVGVGDYKSRRVPDLQGAPNDAERIYTLLTDEAAGYGFPKSNVCLLLNKDATVERFKEAFGKALVDRARENDVAVFYYAGHGATTPDKNGDETDQQDETFVLHDSRTGGKGDLVDDEFNAMLARLHRKTKNVTLIIDSCNSGTANRGEAGTAVARLAEPWVGDEGPGADVPGDGGEWVPESMDGLVVLTAAKDGSSALEIDGGGVFTDALLEVLSVVGDAPLTYAQASRQIPLLVASRSSQIPFFQGDLRKAVFGNTSRTRPLAWEVSEIDGNLVKLGGTPLPGVGRGAEMRIYDGSAKGSQTRDPAKAKATVVVDSATGVEADAHIVARGAGKPEVVAGDLAVLVRPGDEFVKYSLRFRSPAEADGIAEQRRARIIAAIEQNPETAKVVTIVEGAADFELRTAIDGKLQLRGPENTVLITYDSEEDVVANLWQHARQRALLRLKGEGGADFVDNETLQVSLVPAARQTPCADGVWQQAAPNETQIIPLCHRWHVQVALSPDSPLPLRIGAVILSSDGGIYGLPADGRTVLLNPGETVKFNRRNETFQGGLPLDSQDRVMAFGTQETNAVRWHELTAPATTRSLGQSGLGRALERYLRPGTRGQSLAEDDIEDNTWTLSAMTMRVEANSRFSSPRAQGQPNRREYTIQNFDIRPYLPDNTSTALYKVLEKADWLANASAKTEDGFPYKQHEWEAPDDEANLELGIDASRSIWFAFSRAGISYNGANDRYLTTADMWKQDSLMNDEFERCDDQPAQLGDVIVYRDERKQLGHTVMVIDPQKRIAWGSHGFDGCALKGLSDAAKKARGCPPESFGDGGARYTEDTGVEYQKLKKERDWQFWNTGAMQRKACWRHRRFVQEAKAPGGQPGTAALKDVCDKRKCAVAN